MWRARIAVPGLAVLAALAPVIAPARGSAPGEPLRLTVAADEIGWISVAVRGPRDGPVVVREISGANVARLTLRGGTAERRRAVRWRCERRTRRLEATMAGPGGETASATITTPSCADRLRMIVVPARVRPGQAVRVSVTDTWRFGGVSATVCARPGPAATSCRRVSLPAGTSTRRARVRLRKPGRRTIALRTASGQRLEAPVEVRRDARLRVLVTGDSLTYGLYLGLGLVLGDGASVTGDAQPGRGITTPLGLDWPAHAQRMSRTTRPDVTIVALGSADGGYPLTAPTGEAVLCCDARWVAEYARIASGMMTSFLRDGHGVVYWLVLPAPSSPEKAKILRAENDAVRQAGTARDGVRVVERVARVISPGDRFHEAISFEGRQVVVRDPDGIHLSPDGNNIAIDILKAALRADGLLP